MAVLGGLMKYYGAVEAGGTKFVCSIASDPDHYVEEVRFPTTKPEETIGRTIDFFKEQMKKQPISIQQFQMARD